MGWPQVTTVALMAMSIGIHIVKHGEHREPYSMWVALTSSGIYAGLLYAGGFFNQPN